MCMNNYKRKILNGFANNVIIMYLCEDNVKLSFITDVKVYTFQPVCIVKVILNYEIHNLQITSCYYAKKEPNVH